MRPLDPIGAIDGRPLFAYRLSAAQHAALQARLAERLSLSDPARLPEDTCAQFCLYASGWWHRHHGGGPWAWADVLRPLGVGGTADSHLHAWTRRGLRRLDREVTAQSGRNLYLMTLAAEGGLPLALVKKKGHKLHRFFRSVFRALEADVETHPARDRVVEIARRRQFDLPRSLRQEAVFQLAGWLAADLWPLVLDAGGKEAPLQWLDANRPGWRDELPIELGDGDARSFLERLVSEARDIRRGVGALVEVQTWLRQDPDSEAWRVTRGLVIPDRIEVAQVRDWLGDHAECPAIRLRISAGIEQELAGVLRRKGDTFYAESYAGRIRDRVGEVDLEITSRVRQGERMEVPGGSALGPLPWVFRRRRERWELFATGACSTTDEQLWVAPPPGAEVRGEHRLVGTLEGEDRQLYAVSGEVDVVAEDGPCRIRTRAASADRRRHVFRGPRHDVLSSARPMFRGWPRLLEYDEEGAKRDVPYEIRTHHGWESPDGHAGEFTARVVAEDGVVFAQRVRVVPEDIGLALQIAAKRGSVCVSGRGLAAASIAATEGVAITRTGEGTDRCFEVVLEGEKPPPSLRLTLEFDGRPVRAEIPCPVEMKAFFSRDGSPLQFRQVVHVSELGGVQAQVAEPRRGDHRVELQLVGTDLRRTVKLRPGPGQTSRLDLRAVQDEARAMLAQSMSPDATLELRLFSLAGSGRSPQLRVCRYDWKPDLEKNHGEVHLRVASGTARPIVEARRFRDIEVAEPLPWLPDLEDGTLRWSFDPASRAGGGWLITVRDGVWHRGRPTLWSVIQDDADELIGLKAGFEIPNERSRMRYIEHALTHLVRDQEHPDWAVLEPFLKVATDLPASTFDILRILCRHRLLPLVAMRTSWDADDRPAVLGALDELPLCWEAIPRGAWEQAFLALYELEESITPGSGLKALLGYVDDLSDLVDVTPFFVHWWWRRTGEAPAGIDGKYLSLLHPMVKPHLLDRRQELLGEFRHRKVDLQSDQWPRAAPPEAGALSMGAHGSYHQVRTIDAPVSAAEFALSSPDMPTPEQARAWREARDFDPLYFREVWQCTVAAALAPEDD